jgi:hypothetical protein
MRTFLKKISPLLLFVAFGLSLACISPPAYAAQCGTGEGGVQTSFDFGCPGDTDAKSNELDKNPIYIVLLYLVNTLSAGIGVVIAGSIIWQSVQYASANGQPDKAKNARNGIVNAVIGLILFLTMFAILNFIIPGGIFEG